MKNSYIEKIKSRFPEFELPLGRAEQEKLNAASNLKVQSRFVAKSERVQELKKELELANKLRARADKMSMAWLGDPRRPGSPVPCFPYFYDKDIPFDKYVSDGTDAAVRELVDKAQGDVNFYKDSVKNAAKALANTLASACNQLEYALESENKGIDGESRVEAYLSRKLDCRILSSVILPSVQENENAPKTAETDLLVIAGQGVFVCEVKNYGKAGQTLEVQPDGEIVKKDYYGRVLDYMGSPFKQNTHHCAAVGKVLAEAGLVNVPIYPIVLIANTDVNVVNSGSYQMMDMYRFANMICANTASAYLSEELQEMTFTAIQRKRMIERKFPICAVSPIAEQVSEALGYLETALAKHSKDQDWGEKVGESVDNWVKETQKGWKHRHPMLYFYWILRYFGFVFQFLGFFFVIFFRAIVKGMYGIEIPEYGSFPLFVFNFIYPYSFMLTYLHTQFAVMGGGFAAFIKSIIYVFCILASIGIMFYANYFFLF